MQGFYDYIKSRNPELLVTANIHVNPKHVGGPWFCLDVPNLLKTVDLVVDQSGNEPRLFDDGSLLTQIGELKIAHALKTPVLALNDSDAAGDGSVDTRYTAALFEALFGGGIPVDRVVMKPERGGNLNQARFEQRKDILKKVREIADKYDDILSLKEYTPVGILYSRESFDFSKAATEDYFRVQESCLRSHVPFQVIVSERNGIVGGIPEDCSVLLVPNTRCISDKVVEELKNFKGKLVLVGDLCGDFDENYCEREKSPFADFPHEKMAVQPHTVLSASWITRLKPAENEEFMSFDCDIDLQFAPEVRSICKLDGEKIRAVLLSSVKEVGKGKVTFTANNTPKSMTIVTLDGEKSVEINSDSVEIPAFSGMQMLIFE